MVDYYQGSTTVDRLTRPEGGVWRSVKSGVERFGASDIMSDKGNAPARVCFPYAGVELGGSHISSLGLIEQLDRSRYEPIVLLKELDGPVYDLFREHDIPVELAPETRTIGAGQRFGPKSAAKAAATFGRLTNHLKKMNVDIVHGNDGRTNAVWGVPTKLAGAKFVWHQRSAPSSRGLRFVAPIIADRVITVSKFASPRPGFISAASKNEVIYSPFDTSLSEDRNGARAALLSELGCAPDTKFVGYFGSLIERKRPVLFVDTIASLIEQAPDVPVMGLLFGEAFDGFDRLVTERAKQKNISDKIQMMGFRSPGSKWLAACDTLLVPAIDEPFGRTLIEAMLLETPIVATDSGGNPEAIIHKETGLLAPPEDPTALAAATARVLQDQSLATRITKNAKTDAKERFGVDKHAEAVMAIYDELLQ